MTTQPITVIILTYNEEPNILQCLNSVVNWASEVIVLDSCSTDQTVVLAKRAGADVYYRRFDNYANQRNYAVRELPIHNRWILFLDADEYLNDPIKEEIGRILQRQGSAYAGYFIRLNFYFLGKWIRHGGYNTNCKLVLFQRDKFLGVERPIDEHVMLKGRLGYLQQPLIHNDQKGVKEWLKKHLQYADLQAGELTKPVSNMLTMPALSSHSREQKRWIKEYVWPHIPLFIRASLYFGYRYFLRLGFLDGKAGFLFHFNHAFLFHFIIGTLYYERTSSIKSKPLKESMSEPIL